LGDLKQEQSSTIRKGTLPDLLLAGPILRRVEPSSVSIWLAYRIPVTAKAEIFRFVDLEAAGVTNDDGERFKLPTPIGIGYAKSIRLGKNLHIVLVTAKPVNRQPSSLAAEQNPATFPESDLLAYEITIKTEDSRADNSKFDQEGFSSMPRSGELTYRRDKTGHYRPSFPTFLIPSKNRPLNLLYASCRKLHGKGADSFAAADKIIEDNFDDLQRRPSVLFLTGDQIYADDVADPLIKYISNIGNELLGWTESLYGLSKPPSQLATGERQSIVNKYAEFTATNAGNHLLGFGEFAAVYLLAWNISNWPESYPDAEKEMHWSKRGKYRDQVKQLQEELKVLPAIRRVLANISTYMICDDHEITDDWNITEEWKRRVSRSRIGKQVIANGLAAYWAFQGWGNDPEKFDDKFITGITGYLEKTRYATAEDREKFEEQLLSFNGWSYTVPLNPLTVVLDSRTQRQYDSPEGPPQLVNDEALLGIAKMAQKSGYRRGEPIAIMTPTPIFGFEYAEQIQQLLAKRTGGIYKVDLETWSANVRGWTKFLSFLTEELAPSTCIFLSGDVHYAFTMKATFHVRRKDGQAGYNRMNIVQLNSSALKTTSIVKIALLSEMLGRLRQISPTKYHVRIGWNTDELASSSGNDNVVKISMSSNDKIIGREGKSQIAREMLDRCGYPDWIISTSMVKASGDVFPLLVIADNNMGFATINTSPSPSLIAKQDTIEHKLFVRKRALHYDNIHTSVVDIADIEAPSGIKALLHSREKSDQAAESS
jgi:hypothetical protein